jgi:hypothetical protein
MKQEVEQFLLRREEYIKLAMRKIEEVAPLLPQDRIREIAIIALKSWQGLRDCYEYNEASEFNETL